MQQARPVCRCRETHETRSAHTLTRPLPSSLTSTVLHNAVLTRLCLEQVEHRTHETRSAHTLTRPLPSSLTSTVLHNAVLARHFLEHVAAALLAYEYRTSQCRPCSSFSRTCCRCPPSLRVPYFNAVFSFQNMFRCLPRLRVPYFTMPSLLVIF
ncbi:hypothetical protein J6590_057954 [Homalodisca vitripennis]|nr:hypothetical protein J6590_057954 [Homalodisca vitripennis]